MVSSISSIVSTKINLIDNQTTTIKSELAELKENKKKIEELKVSEAIFQKKIIKRVNTLPPESAQAHRRL